jgi:hypothetical protein
MASREALDAAVEYYERNRDTFPRAIIPLLRDRFGLTALEAIEVQRIVVKKQGGADASH